MNIPFQGQISNRDLTDIFTLALKSQRWIAYVFLPLSLLSVAPLILSIVNDAFNPMLLFLVVFTGVFGAYPFWGPGRSATTAYNTQPEMRGTYVGAINEEEILLRTINATVNLKWSGFTQVVRNEKFVLLYQNPRCFNFFPRSFFSTDDNWRDFNALIDQKVQGGTFREGAEKIDRSTFSTLPRWLIIFVVGGIGGSFLCFIIALIVMLVYNFTN